jgi:hypothetical protein
MEFVKDCSFEQIKEKAKENNLYYREEEDLYLLTAKKSDMQTNLQRSCNGVILEKETNKIVCSCQPNFANVEKSEKNIFELIENGTASMEYCEDGTVVRLYNHKNEWKTATSKCIDAKNSCWASQQTFDEMFWDLFPIENLNSLDSNCTYVFVLIHKDNRIVIKHSVNELVFIGVINNNTGENIRDFHFENETSIRRSDSIELKIQKNEFTNENGNENGIFEKLYNPNKRGVLISVENVTYKFDFSSFQIIKDIRGNVPQIRMRYLELLDNEEGLKMLEQYYSEYHMLFTMIKYTLEKLYKHVYILYVKSHIKHNIKIEEGHLFFVTLRQLHGQYKKTNQAITLDDVKNKINSLDKYIVKNFLGWV